jgi:Protein of unknown function (DUF3987)
MIPAPDFLLERPNNPYVTGLSSIRKGFAPPHFGDAYMQNNTPRRARKKESAVTLDHPGPGQYTWAQPDDSLLEDSRGDLPDFPDDAFPPRLLKWLVRATRGAGVWVDHVVIPLLGVASSLIGTARRVSASSSWSEPMTLWVCVVAPSGERKTPGLNVVLRALDQIEEDNVPAHREAQRTHKARVQKSRDDLRRWRKARQEALNAKPPQEPPAMPAEAVDLGDFIWPALYVGDTTIERLVKLLEARPRGMMLIRDELAGLFANMFRYGSNARPFYLEAWNGKRHVVERVQQQKNIAIPHLLVGIVGGFQPDKLARAFSGDEDGMYGRFLYGWPAPTDYTPLTNEVAEIEPEFQNLLTNLIRLPSESTDNRFVPTTIPLSQGAVARFEEYRVFVNRTKQALDGRERQWFAKSESQVLRLAGTLAYLSWASRQEGSSSSTGFESISAGLEPAEIAEQFMVNAIKLVQDYFWPHARAALRQIGLTDHHRHARRVLRWIRVNHCEQVSLKDIRREALGGALDAEETHDLLDRMETAGWLRLDTTKTGGRPLHRWLANPKLFESMPAGDAETAQRSCA